MDGMKFKDELANSDLSYEKMIGKLRMEKNGELSFSLPPIKTSEREPWDFKTKWLIFYLFAEVFW